MRTRYWIQVRDEEWFDVWHDHLSNCYTDEETHLATTFADARIARQLNPGRYFRIVARAADRVIHENHPNL